MRRAALVTGGSSGIGLEIARVLAQDGHAVTLVGRSEEKLRRAAEALGDAAHTVAADVSDEAGAIASVRSHAERFGRLDVLVNSAGIARPGAVDATATEDLDAQLATNLRGPFLVIREALVLLRSAGAEHGKALIVNLASVAGKQGQPGNAAYSATKAALISLTESVQRRTAGAGIQATALCPGLVATPMTEGSPVPAAEMVSPSDVAEAVRFLLRTSRFCLVPEIVLNRRGAVS